MSALRVKDVSVTVGSKSLLRDVEFGVEAGEWVALIGPNGAGKSTLLRAIAGDERGTGVIEADGVALRSLSARARAQRVAVVTQSPVIPTAMRVVDYVLLGRTPYIRPLGVETEHDIAVVTEVLEQLDLRSVASRTVDSLSGGERQRVCIARALAQQTSVLLLDEPTTALDVGHQQDVLELIDDLRRTRGLAVVSALHDLTLASRYPDRILLLVDGVVEAIGLPAEVLTEAHLERFYGARVRILCDEDGITVVPVRPR